ncbi:MAG: hypothetical protein ACRC5A_17425, partial [Enterobacteriaceae bacterium]
MAESPKIFNLERFEYLVNINAQEEATNELLFLLSQVDNYYGQWGGQVTANTNSVSAGEINQHVCTRLAGAITTLFSRPNFGLTEEGFIKLMLFYRWLAMIFAVSGYRNGDHIIFSHNIAGGGQTESLTINSETFKIFCLSYYPDSRIELQMDTLWQYDWKRTANLLFAILSCRILPTSEAYDKREKILAWLPEKLRELETIADVPQPLLHEAYMFCSYATLPQKHQIKVELNRMIRNTLLQNGKKDIEGAPPVRDKPVAFVIMEWFNSRHSVYRTHSVSLRALSKKYMLCAIVVDMMLDNTSMQIFDEVYSFDKNEIVDKTIELADFLKPELVYYPGIGMFQHTVHLSNLRLAPLQVVSLGHGASTFSSMMDAFILEEDLVGDPACFSERVVPVPVGAMPFCLTEQVYDLPGAKREARQEYSSDYPVRVAVCASIMKINPHFLQTLAEVQQRSRVPVQFCFYVVSAMGIVYDYLLHTIRALLPGAEVNAQQPPPEYLQSLKSCDMFVNPFPYGNMNSLVDVITQRLPGICMNGPELHTHIDGALFQRMGMPQELVAYNREEYIRACLHLIEDHAWRAELQQMLIKEKPEQRLLQGQPELFVEAVTQLQLEKVIPEPVAEIVIPQAAPVVEVSPQQVAPVVAEVPPQQATPVMVEVAQQPEEPAEAIIRAELPVESPAVSKPEPEIEPEPEEEFNPMFAAPPPAKPTHLDGDNQ